MRYQVQSPDGPPSMFAPFIEFFRNSRLVRSVVLTTGVFSFLLWLYIVARIVVNGVDVNKPFVTRVPGISFAALGAISFGVSFVAMLLYVWLWGRFGRGSRPL
jgi:hypothetical protein